MVMDKTILHSALVIILVAIIPQLLVGCDEKESEVDRLNRRIAEFRSELDAAQQRTGSLAENLGAAKSTLDRVQRQYEQLRQRYDASEEDYREALTKANQAAQFIQERDRLYREFDSLRDQAGRSSEIESELDSIKLQYDKLIQDNKHFATQIDTLSEKANQSTEFENELASTKKRLREIAAIRPHFFLTLLESHDFLSDDDLLTWRNISLELDSPMLTSETLTFTLPLSLFDPLGSIRLNSGDITIEADYCEVDMDKHTVQFTFPNIDKLRAALEISTNRTIAIEFGSPARLTAIQFGESESTTGMLGGETFVYAVQEVRFKGMPVARRSSEGRWSLLRD